ncbi:MAG: undecaprenyl-diphosphate phosphatase [Candidatus Omnitrophota bacterium]|nr:undecaprenyl-diphosphate phosphatase [Candidatus Omnitrophota bacterium]
MTIIQAIISGIVQGITEFFPISSSGHLVLLHGVFGIKESMVAFDVFLHFGTMLSVIIFFHKDIVNLFRKDTKTLKFLIIATVPTFIIAFLMKKTAESFFSAPRSVGLFLIVTGVFLMISSLFAIYWKTMKKTRLLNTANSLLVGVAQGISVLPGISRSGSTIGTALILGIDEVDAIRFSFLLSLPVIMGANLLKVREIYGTLVSAQVPAFIIGAIAAAVAGILAIKLLFGIFKKNLFFLFGIYCILIGAAAVTLSK